jgi:uncharacterized protein with FMN-binding domain
MARLLAGVTALLLLPAALPAYAQPVPGQGDYQDGIYQDLAPGYGDDVIITLIVRAGRIVSLDAKNRNGGESEYFLRARDGLAKAILEAQGIEGVEAVSGATGTSGSILAAMEGLLKQLVYTGGGQTATPGD